MHNLNKIHLSMCSCFAKFARVSRHHPVRAEVHTGSFSDLFSKCQGTVNLCVTKLFQRLEIRELTQILVQDLFEPDEKPRQG